MIVKDYHSVYDLNYHLILVIKYRHEVITDSISYELQKMFTAIGENYGISVIEFNHDVDHLHVLFRAKPVSELSKFINSYKSATSRVVKRKYPEVKKKLWKEKFWSNSFYLATTGGVGIDALKEYVKNQGLKSSTGVD